MAGYPTPQPTEPLGPVAGAPQPALRPATPPVNASKLWSAGLATALVAALTAFVGLLVVQTVLRVDPVAPAGAARAFSADTIVLCSTAAVAALAATGLAHLLVVSTPRPMAYLSWIIGLATAAAVVLPFTSVPSLTVALAQAVINLVIGLAIGSLVVGATSSAVRAATLRPGQFEF